MNSLDEVKTDNLEIIDLSNNEFSTLNGMISCIERYTGRLTYINLSRYAKKSRNKKKTQKKKEENNLLTIFRCGLGGTYWSRFFLAFASNGSVSRHIKTLNLGYNQFDCDDSWTASNNCRIWLTKVFLNRKKWKID